MFGWFVALSSDGNNLAVGAKGNDANGVYAGHVFGYSVALSSDGNILAVGGYYNDGNGVIAGHARVFHWNGNAWAQRGGMTWMEKQQVMSLVTLVFLLRCLQMERP
uniref:Uncharacterized protein n=1 Tax=Ditylum brightwellii TaxID=49249 RepID=A0A7S4RZG8_9STRA